LSEKRHGGKKEKVGSQKESDCQAGGGVSADVCDLIGNNYKQVILDKSTQKACEQGPTAWWRANPNKSQVFHHAAPEDKTEGRGRKKDTGADGFRKGVLEAGKTEKAKVFVV